jgi:hypothetical protein
MLLVRWDCEQAREFSLKEQASGGDSDAAASKAGSSERRFPHRLGTQVSVSRFGSLTVTRLDGMAEHSRLEQFGVKHFVREHHRVKDAMPDLVTDPRFAGWSPPGPHFDYSFANILFSGRRGSGPLLVALDTNLVLDYYSFGSAFWLGQPYAGVSAADSKYLDELDCLSLILALLVVRDIRLIVQPETLRDAKKVVSAERQLARRVAFDQFTHAMEHFSDCDEDFETSRQQTLALPDSVLDDALAQIPGALDRMMVSAAHRTGAHVFMTRDDRVINAREHFRPLGLYIGSPGDVFEELMGAYAFNCLFEPRLLTWPLPDQHRIGHLIQAIIDYDF